MHNIKLKSTFENELVNPKHFNVNFQKKYLINYSHEKDLSDEKLVTFIMKI